MEPIGVFADRYRLDAVLGVGGMGRVYRAWDGKLDRQVAVKVLRSELIDEASSPSRYLDRFRREAKIIAGFDHPGIVHVYDMGEGTLSGETVYFLVMQLVSGMTLSAAHRKFGPLSPRQLTEIMAKVLAALQHAHDRGVVHRDIKPANIMLTDTGGVKVMDFGIAHLTSGTEFLTGTGDVVGTFAYLAPEQAQDSRHVDGRTDVYSVGCTIYHLLTSQLPFPGTTPWQIISGRLQNEFTPVSELRPALGTLFDDIIQRSIAFEPDDRFPTAAAMRDELLKLRTQLPAGDDDANPAFAFQASDDNTALSATPISKPSTSHRPVAKPPVNPEAATIAAVPPSAPVEHSLAPAPVSRPVPEDSAPDKPESEPEAAEPDARHRPSRRTVLAGLGGAALLAGGGGAIWLLKSPSEDESAVPRPGTAGEVWWTAPVGGLLISSAPTVSGNRVFVGGSDAKVYALRLNSGRQTWTTAVGDRVRPSPVVVDDTVVVTSWDGNAYGLSPGTGEVKWTTPTGNEGDSFPVSPTTADDLAFLGTTDWYVLGLEATSGDIRWRTQVNGAANAAPAVADGVVYIGTEGHVNALDAATGTVRWSVSAGQSWTAPAVGDSIVYLGCDDASIYAFDTATGSQAWTAPMEAEVYSAPVFADGAVYVGGYDNHVYAYDGKTGAPRWKTATGGHVTSSPTISKGVVYVGSWDGFLYALDAVTGTVRWKAPTGGPIWSSPTVSDDAVFVGSYDGKIYAIQT